AEGTYKYPGVDGLKTGAGEKSGTSFVATIQQNNMRILTVVLDANDSLEYPDNRFSATNELIKYIYNTFTLISLVEKDESYQSSNIEVFNGQTKEVKSVAAKDLNAIVRKGDKPAISAKYS
ncbi:D-alanyl-D-alanine carboxypeptidase, partial [Streptococcus pyogenes]